MSNITKKYIEDHMSNIHTYESFGRSIVEQILRAAANKADKEPSESVSLVVTYTITAFEPKQCVRICGTYEGVQVCYHANL